MLSLKRNGPQANGVMEHGLMVQGEAALSDIPKLLQERIRQLESENAQLCLQVQVLRELLQDE